MNTLSIIMLILGLLFTISFVIYTKKVGTKTNAKGVKSILSTIVAPIALLFLAVYTTAFSVVRCAILNNPEVLVDASKKLQENERERQAEASKEAVKNITADDATTAPIVGNADGKVVIYEFFDYNCGYCKHGNNVLNEVLNAQKDVKVVLKNFPIFGEMSITPAKASIAAKEQGIEKMKAFHNALFKANLRPTSDKDVEKQVENAVFEVAKKAGLDVAKLKKDMTASVVEEELLKTRKLAEKLGIQGTPAFVIGNQFFPGYIEANVMMDAINSAK